MLANAPVFVIFMEPPLSAGGKEIQDEIRQCEEDIESVMSGSKQRRQAKVTEDQ